MFELGVILNGPELRRGWTGDAVERVKRLLRDGDAGEGEIALTLHLGGSLLEPGWTGLAKPTRRGNSVEFAVGIPRELQDEQLETTIIDFAVKAVDIAAEECRKAAVPFDAAAHHAVVARARDAIRRQPPPADRMQAFRPIANAYLRRQRAWAPPGTYEPPDGKTTKLIELVFRWTTNADLDRLFELHERVDQELVAAGAGHVDGNEVGHGTFTIYVAPEAGQKRLAKQIAARVVEGRT